MLASYSVSYNASYNNVSYSVSYNNVLLLEFVVHWGLRVQFVALAESSESLFILVMCIPGCLL